MKTRNPVQAGFTRQIQIETATESFAALVRQDFDPDSAFECYDTDNQEWLTVAQPVLDWFDWGDENPRARDRGNEMEAFAMGVTAA